MLEGITDIDRQHEANLPDYKLTAEDREQEFSQLVARAHEHGVKLIFYTTVSEVIDYQRVAVLETA